MTRLLRVPVLLVTCCLLQQAVVTAVAQDERQRVATGNAGRAVITKPGKVGDVKSPAWTGERRPLYRLTHDDVIEIAFEFAPEFNQTVTVQPDGYIPLKDLSDVYVEGMTVPDLRTTLQQAYANILNQPQVTVVLKLFDKPYFITNGEFVHPGKYELHSDITVTQAVGVAGGFTHHAKHSEVVLFRTTSDGMVQAHLIDVKKMLKTHDLTEDIHLKPGDMLFVPQNTLSKIDKYFPASYLSLYGNATQF